MLRLSHNIKQVRRDLTRLQRKQLPFAISGALNSTAFDVRKRLVDRTWPRSVQRRNARFLSAVLRVEKATKRKLNAAVWNPPGKRERTFLERLARGGTKRPRRGKSIAIPSSRNIKRTKTGKVPKGKQPRNIRDKPRVFVERFKRSHEAIWERTARGGRRLLYTLPPVASVPKRFPFYEDATSTANRSFPNRLRKSLDRALRTARF